MRSLVNHQLFPGRSNRSLQILVLLLQFSCATPEDIIHIARVHAVDPLAPIDGGSDKRDHKFTRDLCSNRAPSDVTRGCYNGLHTLINFRPRAA